MRVMVVRVFIASLALSLGARDGVGAQPLPISRSTPRCAANNRALRTGVGATLGAWVGFVAAKIKLSDWNDNSQSASANRMRNRATVGGALIGAALGTLSFRRHACGSPSLVPPTVAPPPQARRPIIAEEIDHSGITGSVYDLVYSLRRSWLNVRGVETFAEAPRAVDVGGGESVIIPGEPNLVVYLDNVRLGTIGKLREIPVPGVTGVQYLDGAQATFRYGAGHSHGAILVFTVAEGTR